MIKSVIWDVDGVILDSEQLHAEKESKVAKAFGIEISPQEVIRLYSGVHIDTDSFCTLDKYPPIVVYLL